MKQSLLALTIWNAKTNTKRKEVNMTNYKSLEKLTKKELVAIVKDCDHQIYYWKNQFLKAKGIK